MTGELTPGVQLGLAREQLQRALLFGSERDIDAAWEKIEEARAAQAAVTRIKHADFIRETLDELRRTYGTPAGEDDDHVDE